MTFVIIAGNYPQERKHMNNTELQRKHLKRSLNIAMRRFHEDPSEDNQSILYMQMIAYKKFIESTTPKRTLYY